MKLGTQLYSVILSESQHQASKLPKDFDSLDRQVWAATHAAFRFAAELGWGRQRLAERLDLPRHTMDDRTKAGKNRPFTQRDLGRMVLGDALPSEVRAWLVQQLAGLGGLRVTRQPDAQPDYAPPLQQLAEITAAAGSLANEVLEAHSPGSPAGISHSPRERKEMIRAIEAVEQQLAELKTALRSPGEDD